MICTILGSVAAIILGLGCLMSIWCFFFAQLTMSVLTLLIALCGFMGFIWLMKMKFESLDMATGMRVCYITVFAVALIACISITGTNTSGCTIGGNYQALAQQNYIRQLELEAEMYTQTIRMKTMAVPPHILQALENMKTTTADDLKGMRCSCCDCQSTSGQEPIFIGPHCHYEVGCAAIIWHDVMLLVCRECEKPIIKVKIQ